MPLGEAPIAEVTQRDIVEMFSSGRVSVEQTAFAKALADLRNVHARLAVAKEFRQRVRSRLDGDVRQLQDESNACVRELVRVLHARWGQPAGKLTTGDKKKISAFIVYFTDGLIMSGDRSLIEIHDAHADEPLAEAEAQAAREGVARMRELGLSFEGIDDESTLDEVSDAWQRHLDQQDRIQRQRLEATKAKRKAKAAATKAQKAASRATGAAVAPTAAPIDLAEQGVRQLYRQLAKCLHPDRAQGAEQAAHFHEQMSRTNVAYEAKDLLALLNLHNELNLGADAPQFDKAQLRAWTNWLRVQIQDGTQQCAALEWSIRECIDLPPAQRVDAARVEARLEEIAANTRELLVIQRQDLAEIVDDARLKARLKRNKDALRAQKEMHHDLGDFADVDLSGMRCEDLENFVNAMAQEVAAQYSGGSKPKRGGKRVH